ncbi:hypothetical protein ACLOJK_028333 [Asimina triloba]
MALLLTSDPLLISQNPKSLLLFSFLRPQNPSISFSPISRFPSLRIARAISSDSPDRGDPFPPRIPIDESVEKAAEEIKEQAQGPKGITDEWGEKTEVGAEEDDASTTKLPEADPPTNEDEWEVDRGSSDCISTNGSPPTGYEKGEPAQDTLGDLKRALIDSFYGTELGSRASVETRAEIVELVNQLEAANPTPAPTEASSLLNGNWVLV